MSDPSRTEVHGAHLVGSVNLPTADDVFTAASDALPGDLPRIPDGEVGERSTGCSSRPSASTAPRASPGSASRGT